MSVHSSPAAAARGYPLSDESVGGVVPFDSAV
jgi:hypothetical protein